MIYMHMRRLPVQPERSYAAAGQCIYCGSLDELSNEHIVPYGLGGRWVLPKASCSSCAKVTGAFEGTCQRTILGPLRMHYDLPTRRPQNRPKTLPLKVMLRPGDEWSILQVDRDICPFLVLFPLLGLPDDVTGSVTRGERDAKARTFWIRAASFADGIAPGDPMSYLAELSKKLNVAGIEPTATFTVPEFFRMLAKIAHSYSIAELGLDAFTPSLIPLIRDGELSNSIQHIGGLSKAEPASRAVHEISHLEVGARPRLVVVRVRLFAALEAPTYIVSAGWRN